MSTPGRRRSVALAVLVLSLTGCSGTERAEPRPATTLTSTAPTATTPPSAAYPPRTVAGNRAAAARESLRVVRLLRLPAGSRALAGRPAGWPGTATVLGPSDTTLSRTTWHSVPVSPAALGRFLLARPPAGLRATDPISGYGDSDGILELDFATIRPTAPDQYAGTDLLLQWREVQGRTVIRADTFLAARGVRAAASYVTGPVSEVDLVRIVARATGMRGRRSQRLRITDPAKIAALVRTVNRLYASKLGAANFSCPLRIQTITYTVTVRTGDGVTDFIWSPGCFGQIHVLRDGTELSPTLEPGLDAAVTALIGPP